MSSGSSPRPPDDAPSRKQDDAARTFPDIPLSALRSRDSKVSENAWKEAYQHLFSATKKLAFRLLSGPQWETQREDLVAAAISRAATRLIEGRSKSFNQLATFSDLVSMTLTILRCRADDFLRKHYRSREDAVEELPEPALDSAEPLPYTASELREQIEALDPPKPKLFLARFFEGLTTQEVARRFGIPHGSVCTHFREGLRLLRDRLG